MIVSSGLVMPCICDITTRHASGALSSICVFGELGPEGKYINNGCSAVLERLPYTYNNF
jgi:hypothetical protein